MSRVTGRAITVQDCHCVDIYAYFDWQIDIKAQAFRARMRMS